MFDTAKPLAKFLSLKSVNIYDTIFILHSKCTTVILLAFTMLLSAKQYFGDPIHCMTDLKFAKFVHSYCWTFGTFVIPNTIVDSRKTIGVGVGTSGVEPLTLRYYQWVVIVLLLEAFLFYLPSFIWKKWEGKRLEQLCLPVVPAIITQDQNKDSCHALKRYFNANNTILHRSYVLKYFVCEFFNLFISICNIIFLEYFLNGFWSRYFKIITQVPLNNWEIWNYHTSQVFPKLAKCTIYTFGLGGSINNNDALCMLPLNILNEKMFAFLWLWFILVIILAAVKLVYNFILLFCFPLRIQLLRMRANDISYSEMRSFLKERSFADWFILYKMSLNVNSLFFNDFLLEFQDSKPRKTNFVYLL